MNLDFDKIREDINTILDTGDKVVASSQILDLQDYITKGQAEYTSEVNELNETIKKHEETIEKQNKEIDSIRAANFDVMQKYGDLVRDTQPVFKTVEKEENTEEKSWEDIMTMD